jgi:hypothetical protein
MPATTFFPIWLLVRLAISDRLRVDSDVASLGLDATELLSLSMSKFSILPTRSAGAWTQVEATSTDRRPVNCDCLRFTNYIDRAPHFVKFPYTRFAWTSCTREQPVFNTIIELTGQRGVHSICNQAPQRYQLRGTTVGRWM